MADEEEKKETKEKKGFNLKIIIFGLPLFIIQLVLVYFITATFLVKSAEDSHSDENGENIEEIVEEGEETGPQQIFSIEDLIINPAGTSGQRLLLLSVGFGVGDEEKLKILQENEVVIKDLLLNTISQKSLRVLSKIELKDSLKVELKHNINEALPEVKVNNIYFSKYVLN